MSAGSRKRKMIDSSDRAAAPHSSVPASRLSRLSSAAVPEPALTPSQRLLEAMKNEINQTRDGIAQVALRVGPTDWQAWFGESDAALGFRSCSSRVGLYDLTRAFGLSMGSGGTGTRTTAPEACEALVRATKEDVWDDLPPDAARALSAARASALRLEDVVHRRNALALSLIAAARALAAACLARNVHLPLADVYMSLRAQAGRPGLVPGSETAAAVAIAARQGIRRAEDRRAAAGIFHTWNSQILRRARAGNVHAQTESLAFDAEAVANEGTLPPRTGGGCRAKLAAAQANAPPPPPSEANAPPPSSSRTSVNLLQLEEVQEKLRFARPLEGGEQSEAMWFMEGVQRVDALLGEASPDVLATQGRAVAELVHQHMGRFLWESKVSLNGHVHLLQPAKSDDESMWSSREERFCNELSTIAPNIAALLRHCAQDRHIWVRAMSYGQDEPGSFHMDSPLAGTPLVRLAICLGGARAFEVCQKQWTDEELRGLSLDDAMITPLARAGGGGAVLLLPHAYIRARGAKLCHRAGAGEGPGLTLVLEIRCDGSGYTGLAARLAKIGLTLLVAE